ncbi:hypothetical protein B0H15DRAFT_859288 [Mycena belliarum]|uniref:Uncharacterized protein n=1 Tax=Mycena belliarum TaxID=1033014 RepID=A0AAD6XJL0_9AGAR|nr:hypothetical protein B0H15DRAFT_859288 [Mycena belliae]
MDISPLTVDLAALPRTLWDFYVDNLWNWTDYPNSWISRFAYTARVLAVLLILPIVVLTLLDIASYGIARTLGVIDDVKASTSDKETIHNKIPLVHIYEAATPDSASFHANDSEQETLTSSLDTLPPLGLFTASHPSHDGHPHAYFTSEENSLKLSGVGVFSPAASRPPSPTITRRNLAEAPEDEGISFRKRSKATAKAQDD